ncbi:TPA: hypothetical protein JD075_13935, partial [Clostridioides difficile]|nr:hypothetical protein [Clostridioides difficile]
LIVFGSVDVEVDYSCKNRSKFKTVNKSSDIQKDKHYSNDIQNNNKTISDCKRQISIGNNKVKKITKTFGFSCFICSPVGIVYEDMKNINIKIEHTSINELNPDELFINTSLLLYY